MSAELDITKLKETLREFSKERDWGKFHTPKNLIMALTGEVGELSEVFQWLTDEQVRNLDATVKSDASDELADILIYLILLFDALEIDPFISVQRKLTLNHKKYPVELSFGNSEKYNKRENS